MNLVLKNIKELNKSNVYIKNKEIVTNKINSLIQEGFNSLQIVSDYDRTITKQHEIGKDHVTSIEMIKKCPSVPEHIRKSKELYNKYRPIEIDPHISRDEKLKHMHDWWKASENWLKGIKFELSEFDEAARKYGPSLRDRTREMFKDLYKADVPILIFSAGLGESVEAALRHNEVLLPNIKIISNYLDLDENGVIKGYKNDMITVLNKSEQVLEGTDYYNAVKNRGNIILMGDHVEDSGMAEKVPHKNTVLKIGFLYDQVEESLPEYLKVFDIVLVDDQTMDVSRAILKLL